MVHHWATRGVVDSKAIALRAASTAPDAWVAQLLSRSEARMTHSLAVNAQPSWRAQPEKAAGIDQGNERMPKL